MDLSHPEGMKNFLRSARFSYVLRSLVALKIPDQLQEGESVPDLAKKTDLNEEILGRVLHLCSTAGVFRVEDAKIYHTEASRLLRTNVESSMAAAVLFTTDPDIREAYGDLNHSLKTGESSFTHVHGQDSFAYFSKNPLGKVFSDAMASVSTVQDHLCGKVLAPQCGAVFMDVGGGTGGVIQRVLENRKDIKGILFETPEVIKMARNKNTVADPTRHITYVEGDFFRGDLPSADTILLRKILHDWTDEESLKILKSCRQALNPGGRLAIIETVRDAGTPDQEFAKALMDIEMIVMTGKGKERTLSEFVQLGKDSGLALEGSNSIDDLYSLLLFSKD
jgi:ubiquinone/menaquinone biosynthesis C-methylase UbiE